MPKISVIMGVYNTKQKSFLKIAIDSILNQTFKDFEFIICDDGSTDNTIEFIQEICKNDDRVIIIKNEKNMGLAYTLNKCLDIANGEYIARMDADDESMLNRFEKQVEILEDNRDIDVVNCNVNVFDYNGIYGERIYNENITRKDFLLSNPIVHPAVMVRKKAYDLVQNYRDIDITYRNEDYDLFMRMQIKNIRMYTIQEKLFNFREDKNSYERRKYKYRVNEYRVKVENFKKMGFLPKYYIYCLKPLIVGFIPMHILKKIRNKKRKDKSINKKIG